MKREYKKLLTLQHGTSDCGVACLQTIVKLHGGYVSLERLRAISGTDITGTTLLGLHQAATQLGLNAEAFEADIDAIKEYQHPLVLHVVVNNGLQHYIVCFGSVNRGSGLKFIIGDPARGITHMSSEELSEIWKSKRCLSLQVTPAFKSADQISTKKWEWFKDVIEEDIKLLSIVSVLGLFIAILGIGMAIFSQRLIDDILPNKNIVKLNLGIVFVLFLLIVKEVLTAFRQKLLFIQSKQFNLRIGSFFYGKLLQLPKRFFDTQKVGELTSRLNDSARIQKVISQLVGAVLSDFLISLVVFSFLFFYSWKIALTVLFVIPVYYYLIFRNSSKIIKGQRDIMSRYANCESNYISTLQGIEPIKNFSKQDVFGELNFSFLENYQNAVFSLGKLQIKIGFLANCFGVCFLLTIAGACSYQVINGTLQVGELMAILGMCTTLLPSISNLALASIPFNEARIAFDRMFEFAEIQEVDYQIERTITNFISLRCSNLYFRFPGKKLLIKNTSFSVSKGEVVAIMGENGCGKSTLSQILQKHYVYESGDIIVNDEHTISEIGAINWRSIISVVPQNVHIFNGTVIENIAFENAFKKPQEVIQFLRDYGFINFIESLPQSFKTIVGEEGINLSSGQRQMIALARALYHRPQLLVLDEATAAMDRKSEMFVFGLLKKLKTEMGIVFITHRLHVLKSFCDRIYILNNGETVISGNHDTLLKSDNLYSQYWNDLISPIKSN